MNNNISCVILYDQSLKLITSIVPSWIYSYKCGLRVFVSFVPAVLSMYTISGFVMPIVKLMLLRLPHASWIRNFHLTKLILPYTINALEADNVEHREFRTLRYLDGMIIDLCMLFTYGTICPFLTILIVFSIVVNEAVIHIQNGSYVDDKVRQMKVHFSIIFY